MIDFCQALQLATITNPMELVRSAANLACAAGELDGLVVTYAPGRAAAHDIVFSKGHCQASIEHLRTTLVLEDPFYRKFAGLVEIRTWRDLPGVLEGESAQRWLLPAGYRDGASVEVVGEDGRALGSVHVNSTAGDLTEAQIHVLSVLRAFSASAFSKQRRIEEVGLTRREVEVSRFIAEGATNPEIAEKLGISRRTVATHVEHILEKLGVDRRIDIATNAVRQHLV